MYNRAKPNEDGQVTIALIGVIVAALLIAILILHFGAVAIDRARSRTAADAVALAQVVDPAAADSLAHWYRSQGTQITRQPDSVLAERGQAQAAAWAETNTTTTQVAPAVRAIMARAEQLVGEPLTPTEWAATAVGFSGQQATTFATVASELGMCAHLTPPTRPDLEWFELC